MSLPANYSLNPFLRDRDLGADKVTTDDIKGKARADSTSSLDASASLNRQQASQQVGLSRASTNPFKSQTPSTSTVSAPSQTATSPRLPPSRSSVTKTPGLSPLKVPTFHAGQPSSPSSSHRSTRNETPTSTLAPSATIQQSLRAAENASSTKTREDATIHVIRQSTITHVEPQPTSSKPMKHSALIAEVTNAVKEAEASPRPPPRRSGHGPSKSRLPSLAEPYLKETPNANTWSCVDLLQGIPGETPYAMIILNQPITRKDIFLRAWAASEPEIRPPPKTEVWTDRQVNCVSAQMVAQIGYMTALILSNGPGLSPGTDTADIISYLPDLIKGDLDSLRSDVQEYYARRVCRPPFGLSQLIR